MRRPPPKHDAQMDLFVPGFTDIAARDVNETMELPFFSISKNPRFEPIEYRNEARRIEVLVTGGKPVGIATIWDKDILIWAVSQIREAIDRGEEPFETIFFHPYQLLKAVRRGQRGEDYDRLKKGMKRLVNSTVFTTIRQQHITKEQGFHWLEKFTTAKDNTTGETTGMWSVTLPDWMFKAALNKSLVLTLDDEYFLLTGGLERWLYLVARKHGGRQQNGFTIKMTALYEKCSSTQDYKYFARNLRKVIVSNTLPGYNLESWRSKEGEEYVNFTRRSNLAFSHPGYEVDTPRNIKKMHTGL